MKLKRRRVVYIPIIKKTQLNLDFLRELGDEEDKIIRSLTEEITPLQFFLVCIMAIKEKAHNKRIDILREEAMQIARAILPQNLADAVELHSA